MGMETGNPMLDACTINDLIPACHVATHNGYTLFPQGIMELQAELMHPAHSNIALEIEARSEDGTLPPVDEVICIILAMDNIHIDVVVPLCELAREVAIYLFNKRSRIKYVPSNALKLYGSTIVQ